MTSYLIHYPTYGITQAKNLIAHADFLSIIKPTRARIDELKDSPERARLQSELVSQFGQDWFTDQSPLFEAITTGMLELLPHQGGSHPCIIKQVYP